MNHPLCRAVFLREYLPVHDARGRSYKGNQFPLYIPLLSEGAFSPLALPIFLTSIDFSIITSYNKGRKGRNRKSG